MLLTGAVFLATGWGIRMRFHSGKVGKIWKEMYYPVIEHIHLRWFGCYCTYKWLTTQNKTTKTIEHLWNIPQLAVTGLIFWISVFEITHRQMSPNSSYQLDRMPLRAMAELQQCVHVHMNNTRNSFHFYLQHVLIGQVNLYHLSWFLIIFPMWFKSMAEFCTCSFPFNRNIRNIPYPQV